MTLTRSLLTAPGLPLSPAAPFIMMYHSVDDYEADPYCITVSPGRFRMQMDWLRRNGLRGVCVSELLRARRSGTGARLVGLTFDDGYADFERHALPVLVEMGFTATVYVVAGMLGGKNTWDEPGPVKELMTVSQVRTVTECRMEIGSHSLTHLRLPQQSRSEIEDQMLRSRQILQDLTGEPVDSFCYPYGGLGPASLAAVRKAGYGSACAVARTEWAGLWALPRMFIGERDSAVRLHAKRVRAAVRDRSLRLA